MIIKNYINVKLTDKGTTNNAISIIQIDAINLLIILSQSSREIANSLNKQGIFNILKRFLLLHEDIVFSNNDETIKNETNINETVKNSKLISIQIRILLLWRISIHYNLDISNFIPLCSEFHNTLMGLNSNGKYTKEVFYLLETLCKNNLPDDV